MLKLYFSLLALDSHLSYSWTKYLLFDLYFFKCQAFLFAFPSLNCLFLCFYVLEGICWWFNFLSPSLQIDSIMSTRLANENDASRRLKSEFLIQFDGVTSNTNDLVIVIGE